MNAIQIPKVTSHDGLTLPTIGLGTYKLKGNAGADAIARAIGNGYSLLDSAFNYENEGTIGQGIRAAGRERSGITVTSKLPGRHHDYEEALATIEESVFRTGLGHIDLYLIHWPNPKVDKYVEAWKALIAAKERGIIRAIGVSNFLPEHIDRLESETGVLPAVNQIELHPYFPQVEAVEFHRSRGIITQAWSPIGRGNEVLTEPVVAELAAKYGVDAAGIVLAWHVARRVVALPKAGSDEHQISNLNAATIALKNDEVDAITALGKPDGRNKGQDPATYEEF